MLAWDLFAIGQRVQMTAQARLLWPSLRASRGRVVAYGRNPTQIRVRRDGVQRSDVWLMTFWEAEHGEDGAGSGGVGGALSSTAGGVD